MFKKNSTNAELQAYYDANRESMLKYKYALYNVDFSIARMQEQEKYLNDHEWCFITPLSIIQYLESFYDMGKDFVEVKEEKDKYTCICREAMNFGRTYGTFYIDKKTNHVTLDPVFQAADALDETQRINVTEEEEQRIITEEDAKEFAEFDGTYEEYNKILDKFILPSREQVEKSIGVINMKPMSLDDDDYQFII